MKYQRRVYDPDVLSALPVSLLAVYPYTKGGRGRPNRNQTRTHSQCATCLRVLRNDQFFFSEAMIEKNSVSTHCKECAKTINAERYASKADLISERRAIVWGYIATACVYCGFDKHSSAIDMHHVSGDKTEQIATLITNLTFQPKHKYAIQLINEASKCIPLCANCHRMFHAGVISLEKCCSPRQYDASALIHLLMEIEPQKQIIGTQKDAVGLPLFAFS